jgi:hypothetical protein
LQLNPISLTLPAAGGQSVAVVVTNENDWTVTGVPDWLTVERSTGQISVVAPRNGTGRERTADLTVTAGGGLSIVTTTLHVTQPTLPVIDRRPVGLSTSSWTVVDNKSASTQVTVTAGASGWRLMSAPPSWLSVSQASGQGGEAIQLQVEKNKGTMRVAVLQFEPIGSHGPVTELTITQEGKVSIFTLISQLLRNIMTIFI